MDPDKPQIIPAYNIDEYDAAIDQLYIQNPDIADQDIATRIATFSSAFLDMPYLGGALGEGPHADFDKSPLYRTDAFDCTTYIATVLALAQSNNLIDFKKNIIKVNYKNAQIAYQNRNHFMEVDWNFNNQVNGYLRDINHLFIDMAGEPVAKIADTNIDKPAWYKMKNASTLKTFHPIPPLQLKHRVNSLQAISLEVQKEKSVLLYLPLTALFDEKGRPNQALLNQIPSPAVIEIVRPDWDLETSIGTKMHISHMGFAIRDKRGLIFRDASTITNTVRDIPLVDYLQNYLQHPTIQGIHVQQILE